MILKWKNKASFYASPAWLRLRDWKISLNPLCERCEKKGIFKPSVEVHHKKTVEEYPELALHLENLESLCKECHGQETRKEEQLKRKSGGILNKKWKL